MSRWILNGHEAGNDGYSQGFTYRTISLFSTLPIMLDLDISENSDELVS